MRPHVLLALLLLGCPPVDPDTLTDGAIPRNRDAGDDDDIWNVILTPNYNAAHDNYFHVDLTPGSDYIGLQTERFIGPNPWPWGE